MYAGNIKKNIKESTNKNRILIIDRDILRFQFFKGNQQYQEIIIKAGYETISTKFFKYNIPTEIETEYAINEIENKLMDNKILVNSNEKLISNDKSLTKLFLKNQYSGIIFSKNTIETLFNAYAAVISGGIYSDMYKKMNRLDFSLLLILREIMHHLKFETISFVDNDEDT